MKCFHCRGEAGVLGAGEDWLLPRCRHGVGNGNGPKLPEGEQKKKQTKEVIISTPPLNKVRLVLSCCDVLLNAQEGEQGEVRLLVQAEDALPVDVVLSLLVQSVEREERRVETRQQDGQQQSRAAHHAAEETQEKVTGRTRTTKDSRGRCRSLPRFW